MVPDKVTKDAEMHVMQLAPSLLATKLGRPDTKDSFSGTGDHAAGLEDLDSFFKLTHLRIQFGHRLYSRLFLIFSCRQGQAGPQ